eukprot:432484-Rhodomonas_salina.4
MKYRSCILDIIVGISLYKHGHVSISPTHVPGKYRSLARGAAKEVDFASDEGGHRLSALRENYPLLLDARQRKRV